MERGHALPVLLSSQRKPPLVLAPNLSFSVETLTFHLSWIKQHNDIFNQTIWLGNLFMTWPIGLPHTFFNGFVVFL